MTPRDFWSAVRKSTAAIRKAPAWMKAGITLNPMHFGPNTEATKGSKRCKL
jgi:hypothetical protein